MRFRFLLLCLPALLGACAKTNGPVRLDLVGASSLTSGNRTVNANDTLTTRIYALGNDVALERLHAEVTYSPGLSPINYPTPVSSFDPKNAPQAQTIVYLDSLIEPVFGASTPAPAGGEYLFNNSFVARATSGSEQWQYTIKDKQGESASRALRLTVRKADSAAVYHSYTALLRPVPRSRAVPASTRDSRRVFLNLRTGLLLPKYAVLNRETTVQGNQLLVDLIAYSLDGTSVSLHAPVDTSVFKLNPQRWPRSNRKATELRATRLNENDFAGITTGAAITSAFTAGTTFINPFNTGVLAKNQVVAFRVTESGLTHTGVLLVSNAVFGTAPLLTCSVKVTK
ncbi:hypothetical protein [Hymenobacter properus]|uniref:DUF4397 domain-containing protein n=1 Tax=Hymenobacter properus TaxID=2791026 RepID=A0A931FJ56_9BACT|nr:hypothetical protein [Hymenobacter properus]MBF9141508.1 hypothetical protein [Hymenobacter properus]MBR7720317.1 hypothetical protein [Microvirga sp. SRT04]